MNQEARLDYLINYLISENPHADKQTVSLCTKTPDDKLTLFRALCNTRRPEPVPERFLEVQNHFLNQWNNERSTVFIHQLEAIEPRIYLWRGDITRLAADAIVNAANSRMLGCMQANHHCIDNIIHTRAGVQLRLECNELMQVQGRKEAAGKAKITKAYNLPANYVIHTVGPFIDSRGVSPLKAQLLASCYQSCLKLADKHQLDTIAFCSIATGEFNFPPRRAAEIAVQTVKDYIRNTGSKLRVIFNVFKNTDLNIYQSLLGKE
jgi:O-acetyl-ADP-ribose deacetylase (regulator of RNase III)